MYVNDGGICYCFGEENGQVTRTLIPELTSSHEEADSKMIYHLTILEENSKVIIRISDTDVLVITLDNILGLKLVSMLGIVSHTLT